MRTLTPSAIAAYVSCPYRYQLSYLHKISPIRYSPALVIGRGLHAGIEVFHKSKQFGPLPSAMLAAREAMKQELLKLKKVMDADEFMEVYTQAQRGRAKVCAMLRAYREVYPHSLNMIETEGRLGVMPLVNPATHKDSRTFHMDGIFDGVYRLDSNALMLYELKSTSDSLREASLVLSQSIQPQLYLSRLASANPFAGICIDIVKKPIAPFKKAVSRAKKKKPVEVIAEPLDDYEERCFKAYMKRPEHFFKRVVLPNDPQRIREAQAVAWRVAQEIRDSDRYGYLAARGHNCKTTHGWCDYRALCWFNQTENYQHGEYAHNELELAE